MLISILLALLVVLASLGAAADGDDAALSGVSEVSIEAAVGLPLRSRSLRSSGEMSGR